MSLSSLVVDLILRAGGFETDMKRAANSADRNAKRMRKSFSDAGKKIGTALAAGITVGAAAIAAGVKSAINAADEIGKTSQKIGISTESLSSLKLAADLSGASFEKLKSGVVKLSDGLDVNAKLFDAIGVSVKNTATGDFLPMDTILRKVADVFRSLPDGVDKTRLAVDLFGSAGADLIPLLNGGAAGFDEMRKKSDELSATISSKTAQAAADFNDTLTETTAAIGGVFLGVAEDLLPTLQGLAKQISSPEFRDGFATIVNGAVNAASAVANLLATTGNLVRFVAESTAAAVNGPAPDDIVRQQDELESLKNRRSSLIFATPGGLKKLDDEIAKTQANIDRFFEQSQAPKAVTTESATATPGRTKGKDDILAGLKALRDEADAEKKRAEAGKKRAEASREQVRLAKEQQKIDEDRAAAAADFATQSASIAAQLEGPVAQANLAYADQQQRLVDLAAAGTVSNEALSQSLANLEQLRLAEVESINAQLTPAQQLLDELAFEQSLLDATSDERERAIVLRGLDAESIALYGDQIAAANQKIIDSREEIEKLDAVRATASNFFADFAKNGIGALDRLKDKITDLIFQKLGDQLAESLFGSPGQSSGGSISGFGSILGSLFGGGSAKGNAFVSGEKVTAFANGGVVSRPTLFGMSRGRVGVAGEAGPEGILPLRRTPDGKLGVMSSGGGGVTQNNTFVIEGRIDRRTQQQIVGATGRQINRATARNA